MSKTTRTSPSDQFRKSAESLASNMSLLLRMAAERDDAEILVGKLKGLLLGAESELAVRTRALDEARAITSPQSSFFLAVMEDEAKENLALLRQEAS